MSQTALLRLSVLALSASVAVHADVILPHLLTEHMVVQRDQPVHIWGKASPGEAVAVTFRGATRSTQADAIGRWSLYLPPGPAGGPFDLTVQANNTVAFKDVLVGDVWVASGQSNMEFKLGQADNAQTEIAAAKYPQIRRTLVERKIADYPMEDANTEAWTAVNPENAAGASAVAYFFGRHLHEKLHIPIGIIESYFGGTPVEAWISLRAIGTDSALSPIIAAWGRTEEAWPTNSANYEKQLAVWTAAEEAHKTGGPAPPAKPALTEVRPGWKFTPSGLYNAMIAPLTPFAIKGVIWYQGEANARAGLTPNTVDAGPIGPALYARAFETLIRDWRHAWREGNFPFLYVQLANFKDSPQWAELREAQRQTLSVANTGMAVTIDIGIPGNVHPTNKQDVGLRLALAARGVAYGERIEYSGPMFREARPDGAALRVWFDHAASGLVAKGGALKGFEIAGADGKYVAAEARIDGGSIVVSNAAITMPVYVRYAWADNPDCNLYNGENLPASPFGSE